MFNEEKAQFARALIQEIDADYIKHNEKALLSGRLTKSDEAYYAKSYKAIEKASLAIYELIKVMEAK